MEEKYNNPKLTQKEICEKLRFSDSTIKRYRDDIQMDSPYRRNNHKKKTPKQKSPTVTENISKNENTKSVTNKRSKNNVIRGDNATNTHTISEKELIDYAFQNERTNNQKDGYLEDKRLSGKELIEQAFNTTIND